MRYRNENVKWYFRNTWYDGWPIMWRHTKQLTLPFKSTWICISTECTL